MAGPRAASRLLAPVLLVALPVAAGGCSTRLLQRAVEKRLQKRLTTLIGPAARYTVSISGTNDDDLVLGRIRRLEVAGQGVRIGKVFPVERLELRLEHVRYTGGQPDLISVRESDLLVEFSQESLNEYLASEQSRNSVRAQFNGDIVTIFMTFKLFDVPTPLRTTGKLALADGKRIVFRADTVDAPNAPLLGPGKQLVERQLNPLVDMDRMGVPVRLTELKVADGRILIRGKADFSPPSRSGTQNP